MCEAVNRTLEAKRMEGLLEGKIKNSREIAIKMLQAGMPLADIKKFVDIG